MRLFLCGWGRCNRCPLLLGKLLHKFLRIEPQKTRIVADKPLSIDHSGQSFNIAPLDTLDVERTDTRFLFDVRNRHPLFLALFSQDVANHEISSRNSVALCLSCR